jgi:hypothetical protein
MFEGLFQPMHLLDFCHRSARIWAEQAARTRQRHWPGHQKLQVGDKCRGREMSNYVNCSYKVKEMSNVTPVFPTAGNHG